MNVYTVNLTNELPVKFKNTVLTVLNLNNSILTEILITPYVQRGFCIDL